MKKTDTCYYMSITKEENSAFVVANHQSGLVSEPTQVTVDTKPDTTTASGTSHGTTKGSAGSTAASAPGGNGTAMNVGPEANTYRYHNSSNTLNEIPKACMGSQAGGRGQGVSLAPMPPQVVLQVPISTPTLHQHLNLLASDVRRECRMRIRSFRFIN